MTSPLLAKLDMLMKLGERALRDALQGFGIPDALFGMAINAVNNNCICPREQALADLVGEAVREVEGLKNIGASVQFMHLRNVFKYVQY